MTANLVTPRLEELRFRSFDRGHDDLDSAERAALLFLNRYGVEDLDKVISYSAEERWQVWAAESIVWTVRRIRACYNGENCWPEVVRGYGQIKEYRGRNSGYLTSSLSDHVIMIQNVLEKRIAEVK